MGRTLRWVIAVTALAAAALAGARPSHAAVPAGRIAYVHQKDEGVYALRTIKPDGTGMREVVGPKQGYRRPTPPRYSPDGKQLAFSNRRRRARPGPLWLATAAGKSVREVPVDLDWPLPVALSWAPNGRRMVMAEARTSADHRMHVVRIDGSRRRLLGKGRDPVWSPDGRRIAFHGASGVWVVRPNGSGRRLLANATDVVGGGLAISPDGRDLLYARAPLMGGLEWWMVRCPAGRRVTSPRSRAWESLPCPPQWTPDGERLAAMWIVRDDPIDFGRRVFVTTGLDGSDARVVFAVPEAIYGDHPCDFSWKRRPG